MSPMQTDHVVALMGKVLEKANGIIINELVRLGHPGLVPSHGAILAKLYEATEAVPMGVLAEAIGRKKNTVTTLVKKLENDGYVHRTPALEDSRIALISLTSKGEAFRKDFETVSNALLSAVWGNMKQEEKEKLVAGLEQVFQNLD